MPEAAEPARRVASIALVVNPAAAKGRAAARLPQVTGRLRDAGHAVDIALSRSPAEAAELVTAAAAGGADVLAVDPGAHGQVLPGAEVEECGCLLRVARHREGHRDRVVGQPLDVGDRQRHEGMAAPNRRGEHRHHASLVVTVP